MEKQTNFGGNQTVKRYNAKQRLHTGQNTETAGNRCVGNLSVREYFCRAGDARDCWHVVR